MPWKETTSMSLRSEFIHLAELNDANISELCCRFGISRKTGYKWLKCFQEEGESGLADRSPPRITAHSTYPGGKHSTTRGSVPSCASSIPATTSQSSCRAPTGKRRPRLSESSVT